MNCVTSDDIPDRMSNPKRQIDTLDVFHRGGFWLLQPVRRGHRAGMDAMVLAAAAPAGFDGVVADLGAGAGAAGFAVVSRCSGSHATLVERDAEMAEYASRSAGLEQNRHLRERLSVLAADVSLTGSARKTAGLGDRSFDFAIMNPPFNDASDRQTPDELKRRAHVMDEGIFESWIRTAAAIVKPGGGLAVIARPKSLADILPASAGRFGGLRLKSVHPQADKPAIRIVIRGVRGSRAQMTMEPPLILHENEDKKFSHDADAICNGWQSLFGD